MATVRIRKINADENTYHFLVRSSSFAASAKITGIAVSNSGILYAVDLQNDVIYKIYQDGSVDGTLAGLLTTAGDVEASGVSSIDGNATGGKNARFSSPTGVCVDSSDNIYITDTANKKIKRVSPSGRVKTLAGDGTTGDAISDTGTSAKFGNALTGICIDAAGIMYVADKSNNKIKKIWPSGKVVSLAGNTGSGFLNGQSTVAKFSSPSDVAVDRNGNVYVTDAGNNCIRRIDESGNVTILAGGNSGNGTSGLVDGDCTTSRFNNPTRICIDPSNNFFFVLDETNSAIRKVSMNGMVNTFMHYAPPTGSAHGGICMDRSGFLYVAESDA